MCVTSVSFHRETLSALSLYQDIKASAPTDNLLIIAKEDLDRQPRVAAHLKALLDAINGLHLVAGQLPVQVEVCLDARLGDRLGQDGEALSQAPGEQDLLRRLALGLRERQQRLVLSEWRVGAAERGVGRSVDALGGEVVDELGRGVAGVQLDLVDGGDDL